MQFKGWGKKNHKTLRLLRNCRLNGALGYLIKQYICDSRAGGGAGRHHRSDCPVNNPLQLPLHCRYAASRPGRDPWYERSPQCWDIEGRVHPKLTLFFVFPSLLLPISNQLTAMESRREFRFSILLHWRTAEDIRTKAKQKKMYSLLR